MMSDSVKGYIAAANHAVARGLEISMGILSVIMLVIIALTLAVGVFFRYVLNSGLPFTGVLPTVLFPWFIMSGVIVATLRNEHILVDYLLVRMPPTVSSWILAGTRVLAIVTFILLTITSIKMLPLLGSSKIEILGWPNSWKYLSLPLGFIGIALCNVIALVNSLLQPSNRNGESSLNPISVGDEETEV